MPQSKSKKVYISVTLLIISAAILCAVNPAPILFVYKTLYVKYVRITKSNFACRFKDAQLELAIEHAKAQPWVQKQIADDLAPFKDGISHAQIETWFKNFQHVTHTKLAKFTVKDGKVIVDTPTEFTSARSYKTVYSVVSILAAKGKVPDCEFIVALNDYLAFVPPKAKNAAIFTFAKHTEIPVEQNTILIPDWMNVRYWDTLRSRIALGSKLYPWQRKRDIIHWRGGASDSMHHRMKLIKLKDKLTFLDVAMTEGDHSAQRLDPENSLKFKYQIALDGSRCTWERMVWQMSANTLLIKPNSPQVQWFYKGLEPYKNYVPIKTVDEINISAIYNWLLEHDAEAKEISQNANQFAKDNFKTQDFFAYYAVLLQEYAKLYRG
ncbi:MAG TPA: glycosyl transferase family 90 [Gammaproteobacteria bacterium]|nr:glycosyl transferase family 90 [Gammaproteobacteria bacterium]